MAETTNGTGKTETPEDDGQQTAPETVGEATATPDSPEIRREDGADDAGTAESAPEDEVPAELEATTGEAEKAGEETPDDAVRDGDDAPDEDMRDTRAELESALERSPMIAEGESEAERPAEDEPAPQRSRASDETHSHDEEHHRPLSARILTGLVLIAVGGGLALWAGPKVAPSLPAGLGPVKAWLMPGEAESLARLADVEQSLGGRIDAIVPGLSEAEVAELVAGSTGELEARLEARIAELADSIAAADSASVEGRIAQLGTRVEGLAAEIAALGAGAGASAALTAEDRAVIEGLRAEVAALAEKQGAIAQRIDEVEAAVQRRLDEAAAEVAEANAAVETVRSSALADASLTAIRAALASGEPYAEALAQFTANSTVAVPEGLTAAAPTGVASLANLRTSFSDAAHGAIRASIRESGGEGLAGRALAYLKAQVATRSLTPREGEDADAVLSRAEDALRRDNLDAALAELAALPDTAKGAMAGWIARAEARVAAEAGLAEIASAQAAVN